MNPIGLAHIFFRWVGWLGEKTHQNGEWVGDPKYPQWFEVKPLEGTRIDEAEAEARGVSQTGFSLILAVKETLKHMGVSVNGGTPRSSILIGFSIMNHPFWGTPMFGNTHIETLDFLAQPDEWGFVKSDGCIWWLNPAPDCCAGGLQILWIWDFLVATWYDWGRWS